MLIDYHIHTKMCHHANGEMEEYVAEARKKGLDEIGFSDHIPMYFLPEEERDPTIAMQEEELPLYIEKVKLIQAANSDFKIKLGLEADFVPGYEDELREILGKYDFDYILGSIHFIDKWGFDNMHYIDNYKKWDIAELYAYYFEQLQKAAQSKAFDILAHADLIKKFGFRPQVDISPVYEKVTDVIKNADICIEINTAGLRVPAKEIYPNRAFLELCYAKKIPLTLGSDAHKPEQVGESFDQAVKLIKSVGYNEIASFDKRKRKMVSL